MNFSKRIIIFQIKIYFILTIRCVYDGKGTIVDATDACCKIHDQCYGYTFDKSLKLNIHTLVMHSNILLLI